MEEDFLKLEKVNPLAGAGIRVQMEQFNSASYQEFTKEDIDSMFNQVGIKFLDTTKYNRRILRL
jgi:hypothetical protein